MRALQRFLFPAFVLAAVVTLVHHQDQIPWETNLDNAGQNAAKTNRLVLIHFWRTSCLPCAQLDQEVFAQSQTAPAP